MAPRVSEQGRSEDGAAGAVLVGSGETRAAPGSLHDPLRSSAFLSIKHKGLNKIHTTILVSSQQKLCFF